MIHHNVENDEEPVAVHDGDGDQSFANRIIQAFKKSQKNSSGYT